MRKLHELIVGNLPIKILSLSIGFTLWFFTMNINNPVTDKDLSIPLDFKNEYLTTDNNIVVVNKDDLENTNIQVKVRGTRNDLDSLKRYPNAITATVDLANLDLSNDAIIGQSVSLPVDVTTNYSDMYTIVSTYPITVMLNLDVVETKTIPVYASITGSPKNSYSLQGEPILSSSAITITGPSSVLENVTRAILPINVDDIHDDIDADITPKILTNDDIDVSDSIYSGIKPIHVVQKVAKATTVDIVTPSLIGELPSGYTLIDYSTDISTIDVLADESNPNLSFDPIILDPIDITKVTSSQKYTEDISDKLSEHGLSSTQTLITTTLNIATNIQKTLTIPIENIEFSNVNYDYVVNNENVDVIISGPDNLVNQITMDNIDLYCELPKNTSDDDFFGVIDVTLPEGVKLIQAPTVHISTQVDATQENQDI